jgi:hypothetical protein
MKQVMLPSEGRGHRFESCRARQDIKDLGLTGQTRCPGSVPPRSKSRCTGEFPVAFGEAAEHRIRNSIAAVSSYCVLSRGNRSP